MFGRTDHPEIIWVPVEPNDFAFSSAEPKNLTTIAATSLSHPRFDIGLAEALTSRGLPSLPNLSPAEELVCFLRLAAEIEHGLMAQYLYAMYSARSASVQGILRRAAVEEMGHLITVQNLLRSAGQVPHLGRYDWSGGSVFEPFPFHLEPVSRQTIAKYCVCEMPDVKGPHIGDAQRALLPQIFDDASAATTMEPLRIGLLYMKIYWSLRRDDDPRDDPGTEPWKDYPVARIAATAEHRGRHVGDDFFTASTAHQAQPDDWRGNQENVIVRAIGDRDAGLAAIAEVSAQGEGFGQTPQGHFDQFVDAYRIAQTDQQLAHPVPVDPWYGPAPSGGPASQITSPDGTRFAQLADRLYELTLLATGLYFRLEETASAADRSNVALAALAAMTGGLKTAAQQLVKIEKDPGGADPPSQVANVTLSNPGAADGDAHSLLARIRTLLDEAAATADEIAATTTRQARRAAAQRIARTLLEEIGPLFPQA